jgi:surface antigen
MSTINTNGIDVNYPEAGKNNPSQGFRNNWSAIKGSIDTAASEITDLQSKAVVKAALDGTTINNDMANTLISNAATRSFRATTYNLGNALSGTVVVDVSQGDVQYGTVAANVSFQFGKWAPTGTQSNIQLKLSVSNANAYINWPAEVVQSNNNFGVTTLENYSNIANVATVSFPYGVSEVDYRLSTTDCGNTITIEPSNRPRQSTQIQTRTPSPVGFPGDVPGSTAVDPTINQLPISNTTVTTNIFTTSGNTTQLYTDLPIVFTGVAFGGPTVGTTYYVRNVVSSNTFTVSSTLGGANLALSTAASPATPAGGMYANPVRYAYFCTDTHDATQYAKTVTNTTVTTNDITLNNVTSLVVNAPIVFTGTTFGGLVANTVYYIKSISSPNITVSLSRTNGNADSTVVLSTASGSCTGTAYIGSDIWKRTQLTAW